MPIPESKRRNNDIYNAKCDRISARPIKPIGNAIRAAAKRRAKRTGVCAASLRRTHEARGSPAGA